MAIASPLVAAALTFIAGLAVFTGLGLDPSEAFYVFFVSPIDDRFGLGELGVKAAPLMLIGVGLSIGFRAGVWNIGAEGQLSAGAAAAGGLALWAGDGAGGWLLPVMLLAGAAGGMAWASIPAFLRSRFQANEILVSLMLTYVAGHGLSYLVHGPLRDPSGYGFPESRLFGESALMPILLEGTRLHAGLLVALAAVAVAWVFTGRAFLGFQMHVSGLAPDAARYAGFAPGRVVWSGMLAGGAAAGLAGVGEIAGPIGQLLPSVSPGYGFSAIIVAFLGRLHPVGILFASLLMALLYLGGEAAQLSLGLPSAVTGVFQGLLLFFVLASEVFVRFRLRVGAATRTPATHGAQEAGA
jgi:simple sugar transport system permease protein